MTPLLLSILAVAVVAISQPVLAHPAFGPVLARDDEPAPMQPLVFRNLTMEEFTAKVTEYRDRRARRDLGAASASALLGKRAVVDWEVSNTADQQAVVDARAEGCEAQFGAGYRPMSGICTSYTRMRWNCKHPGGGYSRRGTKENCKEQNKKCSEMQIVNFENHKSKLPYCQDKIAINKPEGGIQLVPVYEGSQWLPDWPWSPGTIDTYFQLAHEYLEGQSSGGGGGGGGGASSSTPGPSAGLKAHWEYRGHYASGRSFFDDSDIFSHSWSCIGCPSGALYVQTVGFKSEAVGFSHRVSHT